MSYLADAFPPTPPNPRLQILTVGEGQCVSHCLMGGEVKAQIPCTPHSINTLAINTNSTEHRVSGLIQHTHKSWSSQSNTPT